MYVLWWLGLWDSQLMCLLLKRGSRYSGAGLNLAKCLGPALLKGWFCGWKGYNEELEWKAYLRGSILPLNHVKKLINLNILNDLTVELNPSNKFIIIEASVCGMGIGSSGLASLGLHCVLLVLFKLIQGQGWLGQMENVIFSRQKVCMISWSTMRLNMQNILPRALLKRYCDSWKCNRWWDQNHTACKLNVFFISGFTN